MASVVQRSRKTETTIDIPRFLPPQPKSKKPVSLAKVDALNGTILEPLVPLGMPAPVADNQNETDHQKVFNLIREEKYREAARLAKKLIDAGDVEGFFIHTNTLRYKIALDWFEGQTGLASKTKQANWHKLSPERCQVLLEANDDNRRINAEGLEERMRDMADGEWAENGETVIVSKCKFLNDGQHRCWAALLLGVSFTTAMSWGVRRDSRKTTNTGSIKKGQDRLKFDGIADPAAKTAIAKLAHLIFEGRNPTKREENEYYHDNKMLIERSATVIRSVLRGASVAAFRVAAMHLIRLGASDEDIEIFHAAVRTGKHTRERGCPAYAVHKEILTKGKHTSEEWVRAVCHHFMKWKSGTQAGSFFIPETLPSGKVR